MAVKKYPKATLAFADGTVFKGYAFGALKDAESAAVGEVVFNTSMYGYQEILTDPSYAGQIMTFTYPHIGNVGCNEEDNESSAVHAEAMIIRDLTLSTSNFRSTQTLSEYMEKADKMGIFGLDTRSIVSHLRDKGAQMGAIACGENINPADLVDIAMKQGSMEGKDYVKQVTCKEPYTWNELPWALSPRTTGTKKLKPALSNDELLSRPHVIAIDCGIKYNILRLLQQSGFRVTVVPATYTSEQILNLRPDALFVSNGPGDPATLGYIVDSVKGLVGKFPVFGICLGHQILGQVFGGETYKLKFGHRGGNHPVKDLSTGKVEITVQNHGFAVDAATLPKDVKISHINLNDNTVEGLDLPEYRMFCIQYHPEASPGPHDSQYLFDRFFKSVVL